MPILAQDAGSQKKLVSVFTSALGKLGKFKGQICCADTQISRNDASYPKKIRSAGCLWPAVPLTAKSAWTHFQTCFQAIYRTT